MGTILKPFMAIFLFTTLIGTSPAQAMMNRIDEMKEQLQSKGYEVPEEHTLTMIEHLEAELGRQFSADEIAVAIEQETGEPPRKYCFTCAMRVLTPTGYVRIDELKVGDEVYSWNIRKNKLIPNKVRASHKTNRAEFGQLLQTPTGVALEVTRDHKFLVPRTKRYKKLRNILASEPLQAIDDTCVSLLMARGDYLEAQGRDTVMTISVEGPPYNFIVEGFVVHNKTVEVL